jgi:hypothetical protein
MGPKTHSITAAIAGAEVDKQILYPKSRIREKRVQIVKRQPARQLDKRQQLDSGD